MGSFLDKVGLQHFVEKVKNLLNGYLPLSGGTMTGDIKFGNILLGTLGTLSLSREGIQTSQTINKKTWTAAFNTKECNTQRFVLSRDPKGTGLIANNSNTVVSEIDDKKALKIFYSSETSSDDSEYLGKAALETIYQCIALNTSQAWLTVTQDTEALLFYQSVINSSQIKMRMARNTTIQVCKELLVMDNPEYVDTVVVKGMVLPYFKDFTNLKTFRSNGSNLLFTDDFTGFFRDFTKLTYVDVNDWNIDNVTDLSSMFYNCSALPNITLNLWDTRNVTNTSSMFAQCYSLEKLDITGWNMTNVTDMTDMFAGCSKIKNLLLSEGFGRMKDEVGTLDLSSLTLWTNDSVQTLLTLYDRKANGLGVITIKLSSATKNALGSNGISTLTAKGYTIA